jgi:hypothetical protein
VEELRMRLGDLKVIEGIPSPVAASEIDTVERELGIVFPPGYREAITTLGPGSFFNDVCVYGPRMVTRQVRTGFPMFDSWIRDAPRPHLTVVNTDGEVIPNEKLSRLIPIGHSTSSGSGLHVHPDWSDRIFATVREFAEAEVEYRKGIHLAGRNLTDAILYVRRAFSPLVFIPIPESY